VPREIERKFLVIGDGWRADADAGRPLRQAYLAETGRAVVRVRIEENDRAQLTIKSAEPGLSRQEFEYTLPLGDAEALLELRAGSVLDKRRFRVPHAGRTWEIDVYAGENAGLTLAEIELESEAADVALPAWVGREVTGEARYYAARLAMHPFGAWSAAERGG
jgi:adenylate cyclase